MPKTLKDLRKSKGISCIYVCDKMGITRPTLRAKENLTSSVTVSEATMLASLYNVDIDDIEKLCRMK